MIPFLNVLQYLVLALWVGALFSFGALFAPVLFRSIPSRDQAGAIAGDILARIDALGLVTGGIMLVVTVLQSINSGWRAIDLSRCLVAVAMLVLVLMNTFTVRQRIVGLRQKMGQPIDEVDPEDPLRLEYGKQHRLSRMIFSANLLLGALLIALSALSQA